MHGRRLAIHAAPLYAGSVSATLDHLVWGSRDLDAAVDELERRTGVRATSGGRHPDLGTHNALVRLGKRAFLEVLAPDPTLAAGALTRRLEAMEKPTLIMWAARTADAAATAERARAAGYTVAVVEGHRDRPDGGTARWINVFVNGHGAGRLIPFFIEWHGADHPADDAPAGIELETFALETPHPEALRVVLDALDVRVRVRKGTTDRLVAELVTPKGPVVLGGPD